MSKKVILPIILISFITLLLSQIYDFTGDKNKLTDKFTVDGPCKILFHGKSNINSDKYFSAQLVESSEGETEETTYLLEHESTDMSFVDSTRIDTSGTFRVYVYTNYSNWRVFISQQNKTY